MLRQDEERSLNNKQQQGSTEMMMYSLMYGGLNPNLQLPPLVPAITQDDGVVAQNNVTPAPVPAPTQEELLQQAEEERRRREEEQREWIKHQAYLITQEEQNEKVRSKNFDDHVYLINNGLGHSYDHLKNRLGSLMPLTDPIPRFNNSFRQGLPRRSPQYGGESLFDIILQNTNLSSANKFELIVLLFDLGYAPYYMTLLINPLVQFILQDNQFNLFLEHLYLWALRDGKIEQEPLVEQAIWKKLIGMNKGCLLFDALLEATRSNYRKLFDYIDVWMGMLESPDDIINRCKYIEEAIVNPQLAKYVPDIYKMGKVRVFDIVIDRIRENREQYNEYLRAPDPNGMLTRALNFLNTHRNPLMWGGFGSTKSSSIYDMVQTDLDLARQLHDKEKIRFREDLHIKLGQDLEKHSLLSYFKL